MSKFNEVIQGNCVDVLRTLPGESVDLVLTDPPYGVRYQDRNRRTIANDDDVNRILGAFSDLYRLLKPHTFCSSFNGWQAVDKFYRAWIDAGFRAVGHIVFVKDYASSERFFRGHHEQAYLLIKGRPARPAKPLEDVLPWTYTGNRMHPTEKAVPTLAPLIRTFSRPGDVVLDPFCGSGSTLVAAGLLGRVISELSLRRGTADWPDAG